jgi:hypothetical protein
LVIYANTTKSNQKKCNINAIEDQIVFDYNLAYLDRSLPPLGLFLQIKFIFLSLVKHACLGIKRDNPRVKLIMCQKLPLFPIIKILPHKRPNFAIRVFWTNQKF